MKGRLVLALLLAAWTPSMVGSATVNDVRPFVRGSWKEIRTAHAGRPTVVHFWGITCGPCRVEMPQWGKLLRERPDLNLVLINSDLVADDPQVVAQMLDQTGLAGAENWIFSDDFVERLRYEIDPNWQGEIPLTLLIAKDGTSKEVAGTADLDELRSWLDSQTKAAK
jgi:thiol-disulfide isomerase/thioredoxin